MIQKPLLVLTAVLAVFFVLGCGNQQQPEVSKVQIPAEKLNPYQPLPDIVISENNPLTPEKIELGRMLYFDKRLSKSHEFSCNSCHDLKTYGVDNSPVSTGHKNQTGTRNSPTVYNAAGHIAQFWDGRAMDVEEQAKGPVLNPVEMGMPSEARVVKTLQSMPGYVDAFQKAFPDEPNPITFDNMAKAIGAFERKLITPSRWDEFLNGKETAITDEEKNGFIKFVEVGCVACHNGPYLGGNAFQKLGLINNWPGNEDPGRLLATHNELDEDKFKVASLRNVEKTAPYLHDGSITDLETAVKMMAEYQLDQTLSDEDSKAIVSFLKSLTGKLPEAYIQEPQLPESTPETPLPEMD